MSTSIFKLPSFKSWLAEIFPLDVKIAVAAKWGDGKTALLGSPELGFEVFASAKKEKRKSSLCWVPKEPLPAQTKPLKEYYKQQNSVRAEATKVLKHFMGDGQSYGQGELLMWEDKVDVQLLHFSKKIINTIKFKKNKVAMSDVLAWCNFNMKFLGQKPKEGLSSKISWREFLVMVIEVAYAIMKQDPNKNILVQEQIIPNSPEKLRDHTHDSLEDTLHDSPIFQDVQQRVDDDDVSNLVTETDEIQTVQADKITNLSDSHGVTVFLEQAMISGDMSLFEGKIVQIIQDPVLDDEWQTSVTISDGDKWVEVQVDKYYQAFIKNYVKEFDFIKISNVQGSFQHQNLSLVRKKYFF